LYHFIEKTNGIKYLYASLDAHPDVCPVTINVGVRPDSYKDIGEVLIITSSKRFAAASWRPGVT
jgi:hypothetical protein